MPIRFRCAYCNQLMGISHRKAGTVVSCPTCSGQVVVPTPEARMPDPPPSPVSAGAAGPALFERSEFGNLFEEAAEAVRAPAAPAAAPAAGAAAVPVPAGPWGPQPAPSAAGAPVPLSPVSSPPAPGVLLTPGRLAVIAVVEILLLAAAFGAGVLVGRHLLPQ